ncbi:hypothetical protein Ssi03_68910 [Sphaerisporangium siamense]|uniref:Putative phage baseplate assembly protein n=1 Tax=Sphaerisporangium siamense TaxID=795645 RepID=A0A7W7G7F8_9ACTN|nr:putative baseplate assembly protein [Sphaerisporangium siamense]MBB4700568.1 putative phage baseplate assembly protein [Sphaerisporangium siamense]GII88901.1 hypothetical protein Ssi03_68910 [Sphaerisporangium siamense]
MNGRRADVRAAGLNGLDGIEVSDDGTVLTVAFLGRAPQGLGPRNIRIDGGRRVTGVRAVAVAVDAARDPGLDDRMRVTVDTAGDHSPYTMTIVEPGPHGRPGTTPYHGFDPRYASATFTFRPACPTGADCAAPPCEREEPPPAPPVIDYTARDYASLRRALLDRMTLTLPGWTERHAADLGVTLVEALAYVGDQIAYQQDAVAGEAYLDTARHRVSVRRHVRLVDYAMHDGCNARAWVALRTGRPLTLDAGRFRFAAIDTGALDPRDRPVLGTVIGEDALAALPPAVTVQIFEPVLAGPVRLRPEHNAIRFWTWGDEKACLPEGATSATLRDTWTTPTEADPDNSPDVPAETAPGVAGRRGRALRLAPGDVLVIEEALGPGTGAAADADPARRQAVRLTSVTRVVDALYDQPVVEVTWAEEDALEFTACLATRGGPDCGPLTDVTVATGNVVLVDHGATIACPEEFDVPPAPTPASSCAPSGTGCPDRREEGPAVAAIHALLVRTKAGEPLTGDDVSRLVSLLDQAAIDRAGLVADVPAAEQVVALRALIARLTYPALPPRFRPVLRDRPVTQRTAFPELAQVARSQARLLAAIPDRARAWLDALCQRVRDGHRLSHADLARLRVLFGDSALHEVGLDESAPGDTGPDGAREVDAGPDGAREVDAGPDGAREADALTELGARFERLLAGKLRRVATLAARARAGAVLRDDVAWEVRHAWGAAYADGLTPADPRLLGPARAALTQNPRTALPAVQARTVEPATPDAESVGGEGPAVWEPRRDLLAGRREDRHFVGELDDDGGLVLRFGDGTQATPPPPGSRLRVRYRVGNGPAGNVGADVISHLVLSRDIGEKPDQGGGESLDPEVGRGVRDGVLGVRNPMAAVGGTEPEPVEQVRQVAPLSSRRVKLRAVTAADYAELAGRVPGVARAAAQLRWTGTAEEVHVAIDPAARPAADRARPDAAPGLPQAVAGSPQAVAGLSQVVARVAEGGLPQVVAEVLEGFRRVGHRVVVRHAVLVPVDLELLVCVDPGYQRGHVATAVRRALGAGLLPGGRPAFFHPDALTFGDPVRVSALVAAASAVPGVVAAHVTRLERLFGPPAGELEDGLLTVGPLEIVQMDGDPGRPENGRLSIRLGGGR